MNNNQLEMKLHKQSEIISAALARIKQLEYDIENLKKVLEAHSD